MYSDLYVLYLIHDNDQTSPLNGWVGKSTNPVADAIYVVRSDDSDAKKAAIKTFFSKKAAHQCCKEVEASLIRQKKYDNISVCVQSKVLPITMELV